MYHSTNVPCQWALYCMYWVGSSLSIVYSARASLSVVYFVFDPWWLQEVLQVCADYEYNFGCSYASLKQLEGIQENGGNQQTTGNWWNSLDIVKATIHTTAVLGLLSEQYLE